MPKRDPEKPEQFLERISDVSRRTQGAARLLNRASALIVAAQRLLNDADRRIRREIPFDTRDVRDSDTVN